MISVTANKDWQATDVVNELLDYYNNVARFFGIDQLGTLDATAGGRIVDDEDKVYDFVKALQEGITSSDYYGRAVDPDEDFVALTATDDYPDNYSTLGLSQLYTDAGITDGFRRVAGTTPPTDWTDYDDAAYSYGVVQDGDMIGPWLFKDLQVLIEYIKVFKITDVEISSDYVDGEYVREEIRLSGTPSGSPTGASYTSYDEDHSLPYEFEDYPDSSILNYMSIDSGTDLDNGTVDHSFMCIQGGWVEAALMPWYAFQWVIRHGRFALVNHLYATSGGLGSHVKADYYGRVTKPTGYDYIWTYPFGSESTSSKKLADTVIANSVQPPSDLIGGDEITTTSSVYDTRPDYSDDLDSYGVQLEDVVIRIEMNWSAL